MELNLPKEQQLLLLGLIASLVVGLGVMAFQKVFPSNSKQIANETPKPLHQHQDQIQPRETPAILVHVCGEVREEGVYKLKPGDRLIDAVKMAGGAKPSADLAAVNLAEQVKDGQKVVIPVKRISEDQDIRGEEIRRSGDQVRSEKVNINTADEKQLDSLPGVGPSTAKAIIEYRKTKGPFARIEQVMEIPRFGKSKFEKIKNMIVI